MTALKSLSDKELLARMAGLRRREHKTTLEILSHLNEIERRRLHLKLGYRSLFDYCTKHLKYSASAAGRRIQTARCVRLHPEVYELLEKERVNLTTISLVARILTQENKHRILDAICDKTQRDVEEIASHYRPPISLRDMVKPVRVHVPVHSQSGSDTSCEFPASSGQTNSAISNHSRSGGRTFATHSQDVGGSSLGKAENDGELMPGSSRKECKSASEPETRIQQKLLIQFLVDEAFMKKYEEARSLLSQRLPDTSFANVFDALISEFLEHHSPARRKARRDGRKELRKTVPARAQHAAARPAMTNPGRATAPHRSVQGPRTTSQSPSRHIPAAVRDEVFIRDKGRCTYTGKTGKRCESTQALQMDHIVPFARGGPTIPENLRLLCEKHNKIAAEEIFGEAFTRRFRTGDPIQPQRE